MHELSVTESILEIASRHAKQAEAIKVTDIHIVLGRLSSIVDDSVQFYWDIISENTLCSGAKLHFKRIPAMLLCLNCQYEYQLEGELMPCPKCGSPQVKVTTGEEFWLDSIEIER
ncbi:MAG: hydrogenase maturation nickel metallochaperone HypA [Anaerolineae bacterium]|jgi:hydrogenase nickel incorporation protein HypA/HybF|nr:hydrogenase maturation nickel metallochaperone HypA [Anaerolineae bacterium]